MLVKGLRSYSLDIQLLHLMRPAIGYGLLLVMAV